MGGRDSIRSWDWSRAILLAGGCAYAGNLLIILVVSWGIGSHPPYESVSFGAGWSGPNRGASLEAAAVSYVFAAPAIALLIVYFCSRKAWARAIAIEVVFVIPLAVVLMVLLLSGDVGQGLRMLVAYTAEAPSRLVELAAAVFSGANHSGEWWSETLFPYQLGVFGFWELFCILLLGIELFRGLNGGRAEPSGPGVRTTRV